MRKWILFFILVGVSFMMAFLMSYSLLDITPIYYDIFGNTLVVMGGIYLIIGLILLALKKKGSHLFFKVAATVLIIGIIMSFYFYGYSSSAPDTRNV